MTVLNSEGSKVDRMPGQAYAHVIVDCRVTGSSRIGASEVPDKI